MSHFRGIYHDNHHSDARNRTKEYMTTFANPTIDAHLE